MRIGIFDSGIGGLSVLYDAWKAVPEADFIYYADEAHVPYGEKTRKQIEGYIEEILEFLLCRQVDAIVIACNTATSVATKEYRSRFPVPIIGMEPAVKPALERFADRPGKVLVAATPLTIAGEKLHHLLEQVDGEDQVDLVALPGLVRFAESGDFESGEIGRYLRESLGGYPLDTYKAFVLGCTHFIYFKENYRALFPRRIPFVDGNGGTIRQLLRKLPERESRLRTDGEKRMRGPAEAGRKTEYYFSGRPVTDGERERIHQYIERLDKMAAL